MNFAKLLPLFPVLQNIVKLVESLTNPDGTPLTGPEKKSIALAILENIWDALGASVKEIRGIPFSVVALPISALIDLFVLIFNSVGIFSKK
jgi:hypothetical protein